MLLAKKKTINDLRKILCLLEVFAYNDLNLVLLEKAIATEKLVELYEKIEDGALREQIE